MAVIGLLVCADAAFAASSDDASGNARSPAGSGQTTAGETPQADTGFSPGGWFTAFQSERKKLEDHGITLKLQEDSEVWANVAGGGKQGVSYDGLTTAKLDIDLDKLLQWTGAKLFVQAYDIHGHGPSRSFLGNQQLVSNLEATPSVKLYDLWLEQTVFDGVLSLRAGQEGANDELMTTTYGALFINSSFGFPGMAAADLPSGGPNYPLATPFARVQVKANDKLTLVGAVLTGDPAPPGTGDPQARDRNGTAFRLDDHTLTFGEIQYQPNPDAAANLPTTYKLGSWYSTSNFADQRFDTGGTLLASPAGTGKALQRAGDWGIYGVVDQMVWQRPGTKDQGLGVFFEVMAGPSDRNLSNLFIAGGMNFAAPFADRPGDVFGLAVSFLGISPAAQAYSRDLVSFGRAASPYASNETVLEATYQTPVTDWLTLQPDIQYVLNPNAGIPGPFGNRPLSNSLTIGMRATIRL